MWLAYVICAHAIQLIGFYPEASPAAGLDPAEACMRVWQPWTPAGDSGDAACSFRTLSGVFQGWLTCANISAEGALRPCLGNG